MEKVQKSFKTYFRFLAEHVVKCSTLCASSEKFLSAVSNLSDHYFNVVRAELSDEMLTLFPGIEKLIIAKVHTLIEEEVAQLQKIQSNMNSCNKDLRMHLTQLEQCYKEHYTSKLDNDNKSLVNNELENFTNLALDPLWPPVSELLEMANDAWRYYHDLWLNINATLTLIDFEYPDTIGTVKNAFKEDQLKKEQITRILQMTKFLVEQG